MGIYKLTNTHFDPIDTTHATTLPMRYFIRTPTLRFPGNVFVETMRFKFVPATNNTNIRMRIFFDNFRFQKTFERRVVTNESISEVEFATQITCQDLIIDVWAWFDTHTGIIPGGDYLEAKQNNAGYFEPLQIVLFLREGVRV